MVLCVDEKSGMQALDRSQPVLPMMPGMPQRRTHDHVPKAPRACSPRSTLPTGPSSPSYTASTGRWSSCRFLVAIDKAVPGRPGSALDLRQPGHPQDPGHPRLARPPPPLPPALHPDRVVVDQPSGALVRLLTQQLIRRGVHKSVVALENDVRQWINNWNQDPKPFVWTKTAEDIFQSLSKYIAKISDAGQ